MTAKQPTTADDLCLRCGRPQVSWGCRPVPLGYFCLVYGLAEDPSRLPPPTPDPDAALRRDSEVKAAAAEVDKLTQQLEDATAKWERAALQQHETIARRANQRQLVSVDGRLRELVPRGTAGADLRRLADAESEADAARRAVGEKLIIARQQLGEAMARARGRRQRSTGLVAETIAD